DHVWAARASPAVQTLAVPASLWFKPVCVCMACFWLIYRAYHVLHKPLDELAALLGFDIPLVPWVDLASIKADGAIIHWSLPQGEKLRGKSKLKFDIHLNGSVIESVPASESAVTITGLQPSSFYVVRVALVNEQDFAGRSEPVRFRTQAASSSDFFVVGADGHETDHDGEKEVLPRVRLYRGLKDITPASPDAPPMTRDLSSSALATRRSIAARRSNPAIPPIDAKHEPQHDDADPSDGVETLQQLTEKLDVIRRETDEAERLAKDEEEEEARLKDELARERDELRAEVTEKEKASRNLKREVNTLERQNTAAQNERSKQERILGQKRQEREKLKEDVARWEREALELKHAVTRTQQDKTKHLEQMVLEKEKLQAKQAEEAAHAKVVEDAIKEKTIEIRKLERSLKDATPDQDQQAEPNMVQQLQHDFEETQHWNGHMAQLRQQYGMVAQKLEDAKRFHMEQTRYLDSVRAQRRREEELAEQQRQRERGAQQIQTPSSVAERVGHALPGRGDSQRSRRATSSDSPQMANFAMPATTGPFGNVTVTASPWHDAPFLNATNGMTIFHHGAPTSGLTISEEDKEKLTGGALMSPGAGAELLPADLFSGEVDAAHRVVEQQQEQALVLPGLGALPGLGDMPGPAQQSLEKEYHGPGPASPASDTSRNPSVFASPQASQPNLYIGSPDNLMDADRRSVRSNRSGRVNSGTGNQPTGSRFSSMFGIKPRAKTTVNAEMEGPALGKAQSRSMPRQDQTISGLDATSVNRKRNSSISGGVGPDALSSDGNSDAFAEMGQGGTGAPARRAFGMRSLFGKESNGWPTSFTGFGRRPGSPRPGSTHSNELPRPSVDSSRWGVDPWPSQDASAGARSSPLSFGPVPAAAWPAAAGQGSRWAGSRHPSRRPSVQYGASGPPEDILEDEDSDFLPDMESQLAPIGTKPDPGSIAERRAEAATPKLNPAAKDFKSFFGIKSRDKNAATASAATTPQASGSHVGTPGLKNDIDDESPPLSRKSRSDARSMTTTESSVAESGRNSAEYLAHTPSHTAFSDTPPGSAPSPLIGSTGKESFMAKITRKSSSGKFGLSSFKREKSRMETSGSATSGSPQIPPPTPSEADEEEIGTGEMGASASSLKEKENGRGSVRSWSNVLKRNGKAREK
ncbi:hypothetical protein EJ03DRAFT_260064, partial [Teratosphaeria nubilosa]